MAAYGIHLHARERVAKRRIAHDDHKTRDRGAAAVPAHERVPGLLRHKHVVVALLELRPQRSAHELIQRRVRRDMEKWQVVDLARGRVHDARGCGVLHQVLFVVVHVLAPALPPLGREQEALVAHLETLDRRSNVYELITMRIQRAPW